MYSFEVAIIVFYPITYWFMKVTVSFKNVEIIK